jgi:hypothetical protein
MIILMGFPRKPTIALVRAQELIFPTLVQLLASLKDGINVETEHILFEYFSMYRRSSSLDFELQRVLKTNLKLTNSGAKTVRPGLCITCTHKYLADA